MKRHRRAPAPLALRLPRKLGATVAALLALGGCTASPPPASPFAVAYRWPDPGAGVLALGNHQPPADITVHYNPAAVSPEAVANFAQSTCLAWNRLPSPESESPGVARFRCDRPLIETSERR